MPLREPWHQRSVVPTCKRGRNWQRPGQAELENVKIPRSECLRRKVRQSKKCFSLEFDACGRFLQVESTLWADHRCPQFAFLRWSQFQERTPLLRSFESANWRDWNCVSAFVRWSQGQVRLYVPPYTWRGMVRCGALVTKARNSMVVEKSFADALEQSEKFQDLGTRTGRDADVWVQLFLHAVSRHFDLVRHLAQCGLDNQRAGVARRIFFLLRHLSKFPSFKKKKIHRVDVVSEIWPWEVSLLHSVLL